MNLYLQFLLLTLSGWINRQQQDVVGYLQAENRVSQARGVGVRRLGQAQPRTLLDRDPLYTASVRRRLRDAGVKALRLPARSPNLNAFAERFVRSIKSECLARIIPLGESHLRRVIREYATPCLALAGLNH